MACGSCAAHCISDHEFHFTWCNISLSGSPAPSGGAEKRERADWQNANGTHSLTAEATEGGPPARPLSLLSPLARVKQDPRIWLVHAIEKKGSCKVTTSQHRESDTFWLDGICRSSSCDSPLIGPNRPKPEAHCVQSAGHNGWWRKVAFLWCSKGFNAPLDGGRWCRGKGAAHFHFYFWPRQNTWCVHTSLECTFC